MIIFVTILLLLKFAYPTENEMARQAKTKAKTPVKIRFKKLDNGNQSIYLDIYSNGKRHYEFLKLYLVPGKDPMTKIQNENTMTAALSIQAQRIKELTSAAAGLPTEHKESKLPIDEYADLVIEERKASDASYRHIITLQYYLRQFESKPTAVKDIDKAWCLAFINFMKKQETAHIDKKTKTRKVTPIATTTIIQNFALLRMLLQHAVNHDHIVINPADKIARTDRPKAKKTERCYLTLDELAMYESIADKIKPNELETYKAFIFSCYTGLRFSDCRELTWEMIHKEDDYHYLTKRIVKTDTPVQLPISKKAMAIIGEKGSGKVFKMSNCYLTNIRISKWTLSLGIEKNVTFHTARHTFATMMLTKGADIYTTSELMCHASIATTQIYAKIVDSKKRDAIRLLDED